MDQTGYLKWNQLEPKGRQKGTKLSNNCSKIKPWNVGNIIFFTLFVFLMAKTGRGALMGLTVVKGTSADAFLSFFSKKWQNENLALVGLTNVKGTSVWTKVTKNDQKG